MARPSDKNRITIYLGKPAQKVLEDAGDTPASAALNGACSAYLRVVEAHRPAFSEKEWCAIFDAMNGTMVDDSFAGRHAGKYLALEVADACRLNGLDDKWEVDGPSLVAKLEDLTVAESVSVLHLVSTFWAHSALPTDELLAKLGLKGLQRPADPFESAIKQGEATLEAIPDEEKAGVFEPQPDGSVARRKGKAR